jgi:hypothetical protein
MFIETVPNRRSPPAVLLWESYRDEQGRAQKRTLASEQALVFLKGGTVIGSGPDDLEIERSLPHGHVAAGLGMIRKIASDRLILSTAKDEGSDMAKKAAAREPSQKEIPQAPLPSCGPDRLQCRSRKRPSVNR